MQKVHPLFSTIQADLTFITLCDTYGYIPLEHLLFQYELYRSNVDTSVTNYVQVSDYIMRTDPYTNMAWQQ